MKRLLLTLALLTAAANAQADTPPFAYYPGSTLSVIWDTGTKSDLVEGSSTQAGTYKATNAELVTDGLAGASPGTVRYGRIFEGVTAASVAPTDNHVGNLVIRWTGAATVDEFGELEDAIGDIEGGGAVLTDVDQEPVPKGRTYVLVQTEDEGLLDETAKSISVDSAPTFAVDFRNDMPANGRIITVAEPVVIDGEAADLNFTELGRDKSLAKFRVEADAPGEFSIRVQVTYDSGAIARGTIRLTVVD